MLVLYLRRNRNAHGIWADNKLIECPNGVTVSRRDIHDKPFICITVIGPPAEYGDNDQEYLVSFKPDGNWEWFHINSVESGDVVGSKQNL